MTITFDIAARERLKNQSRLFNDFDIKGSMSPKDMIVRPCPLKLAREFISTHHYLRLLPDSTRESFIGRYDTTLAGVITFGTGCSMGIFNSLVPGVKAEQCRELTRLWSPDGMPKNTESHLIMAAIKQLPPEVKLIVSFSDPEYGHIGTVYQATNFYYCGMSSEGRRMVDKNGQSFHQRNLGIYKMRHPELKAKSNEEIMAQYGWTYIPSPGKYRYVLLRGTARERKLMLGSFQAKIQKYPKKECH